MRRGYIETAVFVVTVICAFGFSYGLARTVGLHPLVIPPASIRESHWMIAAGAIAFVIAVDVLVVGLTLWKRHREQDAALANLGPGLTR